jgi:hypothetical protein
MRNALVATSAVMASLAFNTAPAMAEGTDQQHLKDCLQEAAALYTTDQQNGERVDVLNAHKLGLRVLPMAMSEGLSPDCADVEGEIRRDTDVTAYVNGRKQGHVEDLLNPGVDDGRSLKGTMRLRKGLKAGQHVAVFFTTHASAEGLTAKQADKVAFTVKPKKTFK